MDVFKTLLDFINSPSVKRLAELQAETKKEIDSIKMEVLIPIGRFTFMYDCNLPAIIGERAHDFEQLLWKEFPEAKAEYMTSRIDVLPQYLLFLRKEDHEALHWWLIEKVYGSAGLQAGQLNSPIGPLKVLIDDTLNVGVVRFALTLKKI